MLHRIALVLSTLALAACSGLPLYAQAPKVSVADVDVKSLGLFEQRFDLSLRVGNPNDFDLEIEGLDFDLEVNDRAFAQGLTRTATLIPALSSTLLHVEAVTQSKDLMQQITSLSPESLQEGVPYRIKGRIRTDRTGWLPFDQSGVVGAQKKKPKGMSI